MQPSRELDEACAQLGATMLVLFGSHAPGGLPPRPDSDVDLALRFAPGAARPSRWLIFDVLEPLFPGHEQLGRLAQFRDASLEQLLADDIRLAAVERILERIVLRAIDIRARVVIGS
jgi:hypothetical protein